MSALTAIGVAQLGLTALTEQAVVMARRQDVTWQQIAGALGFASDDSRSSAMASSDECR